MVKGVQMNYNYVQVTYQIVVIILEQMDFVMWIQKMPQNAQLCYVQRQRIP